MTEKVEYIPVFESDPTLSPDEKRERRKESMSSALLVEIKRTASPGSYIWAGDGGLKRYEFKYYPALGVSISLIDKRHAPSILLRRRPAFGGKMSLAYRPASNEEFDVFFEETNKED